MSHVFLFVSCTATLRRLKAGRSRMERVGSSELRTASCQTGPDLEESPVMFVDWQINVVPRSLVASEGTRDLGTRLPLP